MTRLIIILLIVIFLLTIIKGVVTKFFPDRYMRNPKVKGKKQNVKYSGSNSDKIIDAKYEEIK